MGFRAVSARWGFWGGLRGSAFSVKILGLFGREGGGGQETIESIEDMRVAAKFPKQKPKSILRA